MGKTPFWKIKRELKRIQRSCTELGGDLFRKLYFRRYYDMVTRKEIRRTQGTADLKSEVAIYLIYPETGVLESHLFMLRELQQDGISPIVVSNLPLSDQDRYQLQQHAALVIERPNVGYDFGGYRDGILEIEQALPTLDRLWLLNDSVWMLSRPTSWFMQARSLDKHFIGATSNLSILRRSLWGAKRFDASDYRKISWHHKPDNPSFHYGSYALCIGSAILKDPRFLAYWRKLEIRDNKNQTVRRGEIGLSQWVLKHSYTHAATHEIDTLPQNLAALSDLEIDRITQELILFKNTKLAEIRPKVLLTDKSSAAGRTERIGLILTAVARHGSAYALAIYNLRHTTYPFLKKSPLWLSGDASEQLLKLLEELLATEQNRHIAKEAIELCAYRQSQEIRRVE